MTLFEFILVMVSLVLAIGVTDLLQGTMAILRDPGAQRPQWVRLVWALSLFLWSAFYWWSLWDFRLVEWTLPRFVFVLLAPTCLFAAITLLFPPEAASRSPSSWEPFEDVRRLFFTVFLVYTVAWSVDGWVVGVEAAWMRFLRPAQIITAAVVLVGLFSRARLASIIAVLFLLLGLWATFSPGGPRVQPGAFGPS